MGDACDFALVGVGHEAVFVLVEVVETEVFVEGVWVFPRVVDVLIFVVVVVVLGVGVGQGVLVQFVDGFGLRVEVEEGDIGAVAEGEDVLVAVFELGEFGEGVAGDCAYEVVAAQGVLVTQDEGVLHSAFFTVPALLPEVVGPAELGVDGVVVPLAETAVGARVVGVWVVLVVWIVGIVRVGGVVLVGGIARVVGGEVVLRVGVVGVVVSVSTSRITVLAETRCIGILLLSSLVGHFAGRVIESA